MKLNRTLVMCLTIALASALAIGGTTAYLTSTSGQRNVMTVGNVDITQNEHQRDENGGIKEFVDGGNKLIPAYYPDDNPAGYDGTVTVGGKDYPIWDESVQGEVDKIVTVTNSGSEDVYVRTIVAFEHTDPNGDGDFSDGIAWDVHFRGNYGDSAPWNVEFYAGQQLDNLLIGGKYWSLVTFTHKTAVASGATTEPSLMQVFLDKSVTSEELTAVDGEYEILVLSQAVQAQMGDLTAEQALDTAFCDMTDANAMKIAQWLEQLIPAEAIVNPETDSTTDAGETGAEG